MTTPTTPTQPGRPGVLIAFEGGEGSGKSTQADLLFQTLTEAAAGGGRPVLLTREPGGTPLGAEIRRLLLTAPMTARAEALLFAADRAQHVETVIRPALDRGEVVITDRYMDSSIAYQGAGRGLSPVQVRTLSMWAADRLLPDLTVLLDVAPTVGLARVTAAGHPDRIEREGLDFHARVRKELRLLAMTAPHRYLVLDGRKPAEVLAAAISEHVTAMLAATDRAGQEPADA